MCDVTTSNFKVRNPTTEMLAEGKRALRWSQRFLAIGLMLVIAFTFIPSTKQAAAIYVLPQIVTTENIEAVQAEAGDLYGLAKQWLEEQIGDGDTPSECKE